MSTKSFSSHLGGFAFQWGKLALGYKVGENTVPSEQQGEYSPNGPDQTINLSSSAISVNNGQWVPGSVCAMRSSTTGIDQLKFISHDGTIDSTLEIGMTTIIYTSTVYAEVQAALLALKIPVLYIGQTANTYLPLIARNNQLHTYTFGAVDDASRLVLYTLDDQNNWTHEIIGLPASDTIAPVFSVGTTYHKDNLVYNKFDKLYRCVVNNSTPSAWVPAEWVQTTIADELARKGDNMKTIELFANSACAYTFTGNARAASFSKGYEILDFKTLSTGAAANTSVGFKAGDTINIVAAKIKAGQAAGLQSPMIDTGVTGLCASLQFELVALDSAGHWVSNTSITTNLKELDWNVFEKKGIEITTPSTLPAGATCFGISYGGAFSCDDYNIQSDYVGQTVTPELVLEIATDSETVVDVATGTEIEY